MRADYDSEANALSIDLRQTDRYERQEQTSALAANPTVQYVSWTLAAPDRIFDLEVSAQIAA